MVRIFSFALLFIPVALSAQRLKTVKNQEPGARYHERYQVLAEDKSMRQGFYEKLGSRGEQLVSGYYKNGKKDSLWTENNIWGKFISSRGYFENGKRTGVWEYYRNSDSLEEKYDFSANKLLFLKYDSTKKFVVIQGNDSLQTAMEQPPFFAGGSNAISNVINEHIHFPDDAIEKNVQGKVLISFLIGSDGHAGPPGVMKSVYKSLDSEALRVVRLIPDDWIPGILKGKPVAAIYVLPVVFKIE